MSQKNRQITLAARPVGLPTETDFRLVESEMPRPGPGQVLVRTHYFSVDPYMRGLIAGAGSYREAVNVGNVMPGGAVGTVVESQSGGFKVGQMVAGEWGWQDYAAVGAAGLEIFDTSLAPMSTALGVLGMPGMTAYFGLLEIGKVRGGESVLVSGAAGAVGSLVGQIAKIKGCRVVGSAGSPEKVEYLKELGFDAAFNYKEARNLRKKLKELCPDGIDVYFDNVGGPLTDEAFGQINNGARIVLCGQISQYNATERPMGPRVLWHLIIRGARAEGFLVFHFKDRYPEGRRQMAEWIKAGKLTYRETITDGLENAPQAFIGLFTGANIGKQLVRVVGE